MWEFNGKTNVYCKVWKREFGLVGVLQPNLVQEKGEDELKLSLGEAYTWCKQCELEDKLGIGNGKLSGNKDDLRDKCWKRKNWRKKLDQFGLCNDIENKINL